jgi:hypothetical protein
MADHVEPGVSLENRVKDSRMPQAQSRALNVLSCIGNEAIVVKGDAKGETGVVVGKHGGIEQWQDGKQFGDFFRINLYRWFLIRLIGHYYLQKWSSGPPFLLISIVMITATQKNILVDLI